MAHDHEHKHDPGTFYLEQLSTIITCAAFALVTCLWWWKAYRYEQGLRWFIAPRYELLVLGGGIGLMALVVIRAIAVWRSVDDVVAADNHDHSHDEHNHEHEHAHDHKHEHEHSHAHEHAHSHEHEGDCGDGCEHDHSHQHGVALAPHSHGHGHGHGNGDDHGHSHGWAPWRYVVLLLPVLLYLLQMPNEGFAGKDVSSNLTGPKGEVADKGFDPEIGFKQLEAAAATQQTREEYTGKRVKLVGQYIGEDPRRCSLTRYRMQCCSADSIPINAAIMVDPTVRENLSPKKYKKQWVEVTGQLQFLSRPSPNDPNTLEYMPAVIIKPTAEEPMDKMVRIIPRPANPYLN